ncbi:MAG: DUF4332 domain-containing protein [Cyanobium sp.]
MSPGCFRPAAHFRAEQKRLAREGISSWSAVAALDDGALRRLAASGEASEARLKRLRGQARLIEQVGLSAEEAALLLHSGVPDRDALADARPEQLLRQLGRFQRRFLGPDASPLDLARALDWIRRARRATGRSPN